MVSSHSFKYSSLSIIDFFKTYLKVSGPPVPIFKSQARKGFVVAFSSVPLLISYKYPVYFGVVMANLGCQFAIPGKKEPPRNQPVGIAVRYFLIG